MDEPILDFDPLSPDFSSIEDLLPPIIPEEEENKTTRIPFSGQLEPLEDPTAPPAESFSSGIAGQLESKKDITAPEDPAIETEPQAARSAAAQAAVPEEERLRQFVKWSARQITESEDFDSISSDEAFELIKGELSEEELENEVVQKELADELYRIRRAKGEGLTANDLIELGQSLEVKLSADLMNNTPEQVVKAIDEYGELLGAVARSTLGEDAIKARKEIEFAVDDVKAYYRRELLPRIGGKDPTKRGAIGEANQRFIRGTRLELAAKAEAIGATNIAERLRTKAEAMGDPERDQDFLPKVGEAIGQTLGADLLTIGTTTAGGAAILGPPGALAGAAIGTTAVLGEKTWRSIKGAYDSVFRATGDKEDAVLGAVIAAPFSVAETVFDGLMLRGFGRLLRGPTDKAISAMTKSEKIAAIGTILNKSPAAREVVENLLKVGTAAGVAAGQEGIGETVGDAGQQLAMKIMAGQEWDFAQSVEAFAIGTVSGAGIGGTVGTIAVMKDTAQSRLVRGKAREEADNAIRRAKQQAGITEDNGGVEGQEETQGQEEIEIEIPEIIEGEGQTEIEGQGEVLAPEAIQDPNADPEVSTVVVPPEETPTATPEETPTATPTETPPVTEEITKAIDQNAPDGFKGEDELLSGRKFKFEFGEANVADLVVQVDSPNFKRNADPVTGVVGKRGALGKYRPVAAGRVVVWVKDVTKDGEQEVVTGRNRLDTAKLSNVEKISAVFVRESEGFTKEDARAIDAESNIRDDRGTVEDYVEFYETQNITREQAAENGLLRDVKGKRGYLIGIEGSQNLRSLYKAGKVTEADAAQIANAAPGNESLQQVGLDQLINKKAGIDNALGLMQIAELQNLGERQVSKDGQTKMFGDNDKAFADSVRLGEALVRLKKQTKSTLDYLLNARKLGKKPDQKEVKGMSVNIDVTDSKAVDAEVARLRDELMGWSRLNANPELLRRVQEEAARQAREEGVQLGLDLTKQTPVAPATPAPPTDAVTNISNEELGDDPNQGTLFDRAQRRGPRSQSIPSRGPVFNESEIDGSFVGPARADRPIRRTGGQETTPAPENQPTVDTQTAKPAPPVKPKKPRKNATPKPTLPKAAVQEGVEGIPSGIRNYSLPALVKLAREIGSNIDLMREGFWAGYRGAYERNTGRVSINQKLPQDTESLLKTLAHEIGHAIHLAMEVTGFGSNALGSFGPIMEHRKQFLGETQVAKRLLPFKRVEHDGETYGIGVAFGELVLRKYRKPTDTQKGAFIPVGRNAVPNAALEEYKKTFNDIGLQELFTRVANYTKRDGPRPITEQFTIDPDSGLVLADVVIQKQLWDLSVAWRGFDPMRSSEKFIAYRLSTKELYADFISALLNNSAWVEKNFPDLYRAFQLSIVGKPRVMNAMVAMDALLADQPAFSKLLAEESSIAAEMIVYVMDGTLRSKLKERKLTLEKFRKFRQNFWKQSTRLFVDLMVPVDVMLKEEIKFIKEDAAKARAELNDLAQKTNMPAKLFEEKKAELQVRIDGLRSEILQREDAILEYRNVPTKAFMFYKEMRKIETDLILLGDDVVDSRHNYLVASRILKESTPTIEWIKDNPEETKEAVAWIVETLAGDDIGVILAQEFYDLPDSDLEGQDLADAIARMDLDLATQDQSGKARRDLIRKAGKLDDQNLVRILTEQFNVRRYLANPNGWDAKEAQNQIDLIKEKLGDRKFGQMEDILLKFYDAGWQVIENANDAGLFTPEFYERLRLNKDSYVNYTVMHHFVENPKFDASFHRQLGTFSEIGDTFASTIARNQKILGRAARQKAVNNAVQTQRNHDAIFADEAPTLVEVRDSRGRRLPANKVFEKLDKLLLAQKIRNREERNFSYLVEYQNGRPILWSINDNQHMQDIFNRQSIYDYDNFFLDRTAEFGQLQKALYTVLSPWFVYINDPIRNRYQEALYASQFMPKFSALFWHTSSDMRKRKAIATEIANTLFDFTSGQILEIPASMPLYEGVMDMINTGRLALSLDPNVHPRAFVQADQQSILEINVDNINTIADLATMFDSVGSQNFVGTGMEWISWGTGKIPIAGPALHGFAYHMARTAQKQEYMTNLIGYQSARARFEQSSDRAESENAHALAAREMELVYGTPRPKGGGKYNSLMEGFFLFWRATAYTPKVWATIGRDNPAAIGHVITRRMLDFAWKSPALSGFIAAAIVYGVGGDDEKENERLRKGIKDLIDTFSSKMPRFEKAMYQNIPIGFHYPGINQGKPERHVSFYEALRRVVNGESIKELKSQDWEATYFRIPMPPDNRILSRYLWSVVERFSDEPTQRGLPAQLFYDTMSESPDLQPFLSSLWTVFQAAQGKNPEDHFLQRPIYPKEIESGSTWDRTKHLTQYVLNKHLPQIFWRPKMTDRELTWAQLALKSRPMSSLIGSSNYGQFESQKAVDRAEQDAITQRRRMYPVEEKKMLRRWSELRRMGPKERDKENQREYQQLNDWKFSVYDFHDADISNALAKNNKDAVQQSIKQLALESRLSPARWKSLRPRRRAQKKKAEWELEREEAQKRRLAP